MIRALLEFGFGRWERIRMERSVTHPPTHPPTHLVV